MNQKNNEAAETIYPTCPFCGSRQLPARTYSSQEEADEEAALSCNCTEALAYQYKVEKEKMRQESIEQLTEGIDSFYEYCEARNVKLDGTLRDTLIQLGICVIDGIMKSAKVDLSNIKISITVNAKGVIVVKFTYSDGSVVHVN